ncbi:MAG: 50S ribosomal protein L1 [Verrucomicrobiales bacterium]|nr:50S ribosomal protein L1 [Verrucomicrobiales bacterium]
MGNKRSKRYQKCAKLVDEEKLYPLSEAVALVKSMPAPKFDETVTLSLKMGVNPKQSDQMVRGTCPLPHGSGKDVKVLVFANGDAATAAEKAGADFVGMDELIKKVQGGFMEFDVVVATPDAMAEVRKLGRQLGPRGLMPNPKTGTVTDDTAAAVKAVKAGRVDFKLDKNGNVSVPVGKVSFDQQKLLENTEAALEAINGAKPVTAKGIYLVSGGISSTMGAGVKVLLTPYQK